MDKVPYNIIKIINDFISETAKENIRISCLYLFGSYADGTYKQNSDIDLAICSEDFEGVKFYDSNKLNDVVLRTSIDIETHTYKPEEFNSENPFVKHIIDNGIRFV